MAKNNKDYKSLGLEELKSKLLKLEKEYPLVRF